MDVLFKLDIANIQEAYDYFNHQLPIKDENYFYCPRKIRHLANGDTIWFSYDSCLVAQAIFNGNTQDGTERDKKYIHGYQLDNIKTIDSSEKLNYKLFRGQGHRYIEKESAQENEIKRVLKKNHFND